MRHCFLSALLFLTCYVNAFAQTDRYTLAELHRYASSHSREMSQDSLEVVAMKATLRQARASYFPKVSASASWASLFSPIKLLDTQKATDLLFEKLPPSFPANLKNLFVPSIQQELEKATTLHLDNLWFMNVGLVQPLFAGGEIYASNRLAKLALEAKQLQATRNLAEREYALTEAYYSLVALEEKEICLEQLITKMEKLAGDIEALYETGYATKGDLLDIRLALAKTRRGLGELQSFKPIAVQNLALEASMPQEIAPLPKDNRTSLEQKALELLHTIDPSSLLENDDYASRAALLAINSQVQKEQTVVAQSKMLPRLAFFANFSAIYPNLFDAKRRKMGGSWSIGLSLQLPITDIYQGWQAREAAKARSLIAAFEEKNNLEKLKLERAKARTEWEQAKANYQTNARLCQIAEETLKLAEEGYRAGEVDVDRFLRSQAEWLSTQHEYIDALVSLFIKGAAYQLTTR